MGFRFAETMSGTIEWNAEPGKHYPFRFEVEAEAESTRQHLRDGKAHLRGQVFAPPRANGSDADGTITIRPLGQRIIRYELSFLGDDGTPYELVGQKDIKLLAPLSSFTQLPADILDGDGQTVGRAETAFDLRKDLWSFLRSFRRL